MLFDAYDASGFKGLWTSDGTTAGTVEIGGSQNQGVYDSGTSSFEASNFVSLGNLELFSAPSKGGDNAIWITDGTANGTVELGGANNANVVGADDTGLGAGLADAVAMGARVFFSGDDNDGAKGLWTTDGTTAGTLEVGGIDDAGLTSYFQHPGAQGLNPSDLVVNGPKILFNGEDALGFKELWVTDGTALGTYEIGGEGTQGELAHEAGDGLDPGSIVSLGNGKAVFIGKDDSNSLPSGKSTLWVTDGTFSSTQEIGGLDNFGVANTASTGFSFTSGLTGGDGLAYFIGANAAGNQVLWKTDGTVAGTKVVAATDGDAPSTGLSPANIALGPIPTAATDFVGGGKSINLGNIPGEEVDLSSTAGVIDTVTGSNGTINLASAAAALIGGGLLVKFVSGSGNAVSLSNTKGNKDSIYGSKGAITLNSAQANVIGSSNAITFATGTTGNVVALSGNGNGDEIAGFALGDTVEFSSHTYDPTDYVTYVGNGQGSKGVLSVDDRYGVSVASVILDGAYNPTQFSLFSDAGNLAITGAVGWAHRVANDLNADGRSDILWRNANSGATETWFTQAPSAYTYADDGAVGAVWQVAGTGDFNGDGLSDILWRNTSSGDAYLYQSDGAYTQYLDLGVVDTSWSIAGLGDFNGDELSDILWRSSNGDNEIWQTQSGGGFTYSSLSNVSTDWKIAGIGDLNGDGRSDILWRNANSGATETWFAQPAGAYIYADDGTVSNDWSVAGLGDFNGDGKADILWRNTTSGDAYLYASNGSGGFGYADLGVVGLDWQIAEVGDFNGDGLSDILWRNANGADEMWDTKAGGGFTYVNGGAVPSDWKVVA